MMLYSRILLLGFIGEGVDELSPLIFSRKLVELLSITISKPSQPKPDLITLLTSHFSPKEILHVCSFIGDRIMIIIIYSSAAFIKNS